MLTHLPDSTHPCQDASGLSRRPGRAGPSRGLWQLSGSSFKGPGLLSVCLRFQRLNRSRWTPSAPASSHPSAWRSFSRRLFPLCRSVCGRQISVNTPGSYPPAYPGVQHTHPTPDSQDCRYRGFPSMRRRRCPLQGSLSKGNDSSRPNPPPRMEVCQQGGHLQVESFSAALHTLPAWLAM